MKIAVASFLITAAMGIGSVEDHKMYTFSESSSEYWYVVDDGVMGGLSKGHFTSNPEGPSVFSGTVSLENNGGFSSIRYRQKPDDMSSFSHFRLTVKGDGKDYQFRVKSSTGDYYSYVYTFSTDGEWQEIIIPFDQMVPSFRGRILDQPPFPGKVCAEMAFLIANKRAENFSIELKDIFAQTTP